MAVCSTVWHQRLEMLFSDSKKAEGIRHAPLLNTYISNTGRVWQQITWCTVIQWSISIHLGLMCSWSVITTFCMCGVPSLGTIALGTAGSCSSIESEVLLRTQTSHASLHAFKCTFKISDKRLTSFSNLLTYLNLSVQSLLFLERGSHAWVWRCLTVDT